MAKSQKPIILCVDDEETPLLLRQCLLQKAGYNVIIARSAQEALTMVENSAVDLVLSDYLMPLMNGAELALQIKANRPTLPVILLSGVNELPTGSELADAFISKTVGAEVLCAKIARFVADPQEQEEKGDSSAACC
jgi:CheY-like chemotaxis protein